jgi:hypothetical protein
LFLLVYDLLLTSIWKKRSIINSTINLRNLNIQGRSYSFCSKFGKHFVFLINKGGVRGRRKGRGDNKKKRRLKEEKAKDKHEKCTKREMACIQLEASDA